MKIDVDVVVFGVVASSQRRVRYGLITSVLEVTMHIHAKGKIILGATNKMVASILSIGRRERCENSYIWSTQ